LFLRKTWGDGGGGTVDFIHKKLGTSSPNWGAGVSRGGRLRPGRGIRPNPRGFQSILRPQFPKTGAAKRKRGVAPDRQKGGPVRIEKNLRTIFTNRGLCGIREGFPGRGKYDAREKRGLFSKKGDFRRGEG